MTTDGNPIGNPDDIRSYKPFIDGLRAVAIIAVVGYHVGVPGFGGGFVGVDVFFVISGYLIIGQIIADIEKGRFNILGFAARRALRILPPFLLVMLTCLVLVSTVFVQYDYEDFARSFFYSTIMLANHDLLSHQSYFDTEAFTKPLLHLWSLSVEEQFYLVAPVSLLALYALTKNLSIVARRQVRTLAAAGLAIASFVACIVLTYGRHNVAFYVMPTRGWEFILGGVAPDLVAPLRGKFRTANDAVAGLGMAALVLAIVMFNADTVFYPSYRAALPALGTMLVIAGGLAEPRNPVARVWQCDRS